MKQKQDFVKDVRNKNLFIILVGWAMLDLNQRPHPYQGCALTN